MRLLHVCPRYPPAVGGSEHYMQTISQGLVQRGHDVTVLTTSAVEPGGLFDHSSRRHENAYQRQGPLQILRFPVPQGGAWYQQLPEATRRRPSFPCEGILEFVHQVQPEQFDLVHVTCFPYAILLYAAEVAARRARCALLLTPFMHSHPDLARHFQQPILQHLAQRADLTLCQTQHEKRFLAQWNVPEERLALFGLTIDRTRPLPGMGVRFRSKYQLGDASIVAHLASNDRLKGTESILDIAPRLADQEVILVIAGNPSGKIQQQWRALPEKARHKVQMLGVLGEQDKHDLLDAMTCMVVPSVAESFGIIYLESWLYAKPVIAANYGPTAELIGNAGLLVEFENGRQLEEAIRALIMNEELRRFCGAAGERKVAAIPSWQDKIRHLETLCTTMACHHGELNTLLRLPTPS